MDLQQLYIDLGYPSKTKFVAATRKLRSEGKLQATSTQVKDYLEGHNISIYDEPASIDDGHYAYPQYDYALIIDLVDMSTYAAQNKQFNWILNILEYHSRFVWSFPLKTKSSNVTINDSNPIAAAIKSVLHQIDPDGVANILLVSDLGSEFKGKVSKMLEDYPYVFRLYSSEHRKSTTPVEVFNKTLRSALKRVQATNDTLNWIDNLQKIILTYNTEPHTGNLDDFASSDIPVDRLLSIKNDLSHDISHAMVDLDSIPARKYPVGSFVRLQERVDTFDKKSMVPKLSSDVYEVVDFKHTYYILKSPDGSITKAIESRLRPTKMKPSTTSTVPQQLSDERKHNKQQRQLQEVLPTKSLDTETVIDKQGRKVTQLKARRLPARPVRDKTAAMAKIRQQIQNESEDI